MAGIDIEGINRSRLVGTIDRLGKKPVISLESVPNSNGARFRVVMDHTNPANKDQVYWQDCYDRWVGMKLYGKSSEPGATAIGPNSGKSIIESRVAEMEEAARKLDSEKKIEGIPGKSDADLAKEIREACRPLGALFDEAAKRKIEVEFSIKNFEDSEPGHQRVFFRIAKKL